MSVLSVFVRWWSRQNIDRTRVHLGQSSGKDKHIKRCVPSPQWKKRHDEVVAELKVRLQQEQKKLQEKVSKEAAVKSVADITCALNMRPSPELVTEAWAKVIGAKGLPIDFVDDPFVREAIFMTARAGKGYIDGPTNSCMLPHATCMSQKILPALDSKLTAEVEAKILGLLAETGAMIISDGWTSVQARPIVNALLTTPAGAMFLEALDTSGNTKDAAFIAEFIIKIIETRGPESIVAVCMDGACTGSFPLINEKYPHIFCFICPAHALDNFLKNVFCDNEIIRMKSIVGQFEWDSDIFLEPFRDAWEVIKFITNHSITLNIFRGISEDPQTWTLKLRPTTYFR